MTKKKLSNSDNVTVVPLSELVPDPANARAHGDADGAALAASFTEFGAARSLVVDGDNVVRAGNGSLEAARAAGVKEAIIVDADGSQLVVVRRTDWSKQKAAAYGITDNRVGELSSWNEAQLSANMRGLAEAAAAGELSVSTLEATGYLGDDLAAVIGVQSDEGVQVSGYRRALPDVKEPLTPELPAKAVTKKGDVWKLGDVRLMCGDGKSEADVAKLFDGAKVPLIVSDPPYCSGGFQEAGRAAGTFGDIASDQLSSRGYTALMKQVIANAGARAVYLFTDWRMWITLYDVVESSGLPVRSMIVWDKGSPGMGSLWRTQHELVMFGTRDGKKREKGQAAWGNVIQCPRSGNEHHYTEKPVALMARIMEGDAVSPRGKCAIYDPFTGSGSTLLAATQAGRPSYGMEIEPKWCDVVIGRWEELTGEKAVRA